jgi:AraC-like DNA-binding protein
MKDKCYDIFSNLNLPFETYMAEYVSHKQILHEEIEIIWLIKGQATIKVNGKSYELRTQEVFLVYMYKEHEIETEPDSIIVTYRLKKEYLHKNNLFFEKIDFLHRVYTFEELAIKYKQVPLLIVEIIKILLTEKNTDAIRYKIIGYYNMFIQELYRMLLKEKYLDVKSLKYDKYLNRIHTIVEYTYENFKDNLELEDLSKITNLSQSRLSHFMKEVLGISYREFLNNVRFEHALKLLKETNMKIKEVVKASGFSDHKYINKMMKKKFNMTTLKYRKTYLSHRPCQQLPESSHKFLKELKECLKRLDKDRRLNHLFGMSP